MKALWGPDAVEAVILPKGMVSRGMVSRDMVSRGMVSGGMVRGRIITEYLTKMSHFLHRCVKHR